MKLTINTNQGKCWFFEERGLTRVPVENLTKLNPHMGIEPGPHWWKASALATASSLHMFRFQDWTPRTGDSLGCAPGCDAGGREFETPTGPTLGVFKGPRSTMSHCGRALSSAPFSVLQKIRFCDR